MIKYFRKIRQRLLSQNKISNYLFYAVGEILLVVIGILIALQINNWNQKRLDRDFEITMLKEIRSSLETDLDFFKVIQFRASIKEEGIQELLKMIDSNKIYPDSTLLRSYNKMILGVSYTFNKGAYEGLKSVGLDKISNDSLRRELILIYESDLPFIKATYEKSENDNRNKDYRLQLHNALWKRIQIQMPDQSFKLVSRPINTVGFLKQPELLDRIKIAQDNLNYLKYRFPELERTLKRGLNFVNIELDAKLETGKN
jgi:hypothetical protein